MKEAIYYKKKEGSIQCVLCPRFCIISSGKTGFCGVRKNIKNRLYSLAYGKPVSIGIDPVEKKPLHHFLPGSMSFSFGTVGCNLSCKHCQNWQISRALPNELPEHDLLPKLLVEKAVESNCKSISYTYNEPTVFYEYVLDTAKLARKRGIKNIIVSNGFINEGPLREWCKYIDGANIDLKGSDKFYREVTATWLEPVLATLKILKEKKVWLEITNLIIPTLNDNLKEIEDMCKWIKDNLGVNVPLHFSAFYPCYKLNYLPRTPPETLIKAKNIAKKLGLSYVYVGNIFADKENNTYCPKCNKLLIERGWFEVYQNNLVDGKCPCGEKIPGVWK